MSDRTFKVTTPPMRGDDIRAWRQALNRQMETWRVAYRLPGDDVFDVATRDLTASVCHGLGLPSACEAMKHGVTPALRVKLRKKRQTPADKVRFVARVGWRAAFRKRHAATRVSPPLRKVLGDSWGYHPGVHDGIDLICPPDATGYAICDGTVLRADPGGWWGKGAPSDPAVRGRGDGIVVIRCDTNTGPFKAGLRFCYGHAEHPVVKVGEKVKAGQAICRAGFANAWHFHFMVNGRTDVKGLGDRDPRPFLEFARKHGGA